MQELKKIWSTVDKDASMRVISLVDLKALGRLPRSSDGKTVLLEEVPEEAKIVYVSHVWLRPWHTKEDCESNGHEWAGMAHPDDAKGTKHGLLCRALEALAKKKAKQGWDASKTYVWLDFCGVEQDDAVLRAKTSRSLLAYLAVSDLVVIPSPSVPPEGALTSDRVPGEYGERAWTLLESLGFFGVCALRGEDSPEVWVAADDPHGQDAHVGKGKCQLQISYAPLFLERITYVLGKVPSSGVLFSEGDRWQVEQHETAVFEFVEQCLERRDYITKCVGGVESVALNPRDPSVVACCASGGTTRIVLRKTGTVKQEWNKTILNDSLHINRSASFDLVSHCLAWSGDGSTLANSGRGDVELWGMGGDGGGFALKHRLKHKRMVTSVCLSGDGRMVTCGSVEGFVRVWWIKEGGLMLECEVKGHASWVTCVSVTWDGAKVASAGVDRAVKVWGAREGEGCVCRHIIRGHEEEVTSVSLSRDGTTVASGSGDKTVKIWGLEEGGGGRGVWLKHILEGHSGGVTSVCLSGDGTTVASGSMDRTVKIWGLGGEKKGNGEAILLQTFWGHSAKVSTVCLSADGTIVASGSEDTTVRVRTVPASNSRSTCGDEEKGGCADVATLVEVAAATAGVWSARTLPDMTSFAISKDARWCCAGDSGHL